MMNETNRRFLDALHNAPAITFKAAFGGDVRRVLHREDEKMVFEEMSKFPDVFHLPGGIIASISFSASFVSEDRVLLYTSSLGKDLVWRDYAKGSPSELRFAMFSIDALTIRDFLREVTV